MTVSWYFSPMDISKRLAELARMKAEGQLSDESFESLTQLAISEAIEKPNGLTPDKASPRSGRLNAVPKKALLGAASVVFVVVAFVLMNARSSEPMESKEYKKLLDTKNELIAKKTALEATLQENPDRTEELTIAQNRLARWTDAVTMINEIGY